MKSKTYDVLKPIAMIVAHLVTLVSALSEIWGFKFGTEIAATVAALSAFLGAVLQQSSNKYWEKIDNEDCD